MGKNNLVYVASPYTHSDKKVIENRAELVAKAVGFLMKNYDDYCFYSPICHAHCIAQVCTLPVEWEFWKKFDETMLSRCEELWVLCIEGWRDSTGVKAEIALSKDRMLPVKYILPLTSKAEYGIFTPTNKMSDISILQSIDNLFT